MMKGHKGMERVPAIGAKSVLCSSTKISRLSRDHPEQFFFWPENWALNVFEPFRGRIGSSTFMFF